MRPLQLNLLFVIGAATAQPYTAAQHQLNHIPPRDFEDSISSFPAVLILFCQTSQASCNRLERNLANAAVKLAAERSAASIHMVDTSEWGGEALRLRYGADQKGHERGCPESEVQVQHGGAGPTETGEEGPDGADREDASGAALPTVLEVDCSTPKSKCLDI